MTLKEFGDKIKGKYEITKMQTNVSYVLKLGSKGSVVLQYHNDEFVKFIVDGKDKENILKTLSEQLTNTKLRVKLHLVLNKTKPLGIYEQIFI